jgi:K+/H+ antiporter YhaU regulatory subunit KhtT
MTKKAYRILRYHFKLEFQDDYFAIMLETTTKRKYILSQRLGTELSSNVRSTDVEYQRILRLR